MGHTTSCLEEKPLGRWMPPDRGQPSDVQQAGFLGAGGHREGGKEEWARSKTVVTAVSLSLGSIHETLGTHLALLSPLPSPQSRHDPRSPQASSVPSPGSAPSVQEPWGCTPGASRPSSAQFSYCPSVAT